MAGVYSFPTAWQDEHPFGSGAHWEVGWSEDQLSFFARLIEEYSEDEIEAGLLQEAAEPVFSYGEGFGEITDTDLLAYEMQEVIRPDIELALIRDQVDSLKRLSAEELERRMAEARQSAYGMALPLSKYLPEYISGRLTDEVRAEFGDSLHGLLCSSADDAVGPGLNWIRELFWSVTGTGLGSRSEPEAAPLARASHRVAQRDGAVLRRSLALQHRLLQGATCWGAEALDGAGGASSSRLFQPLAS